VDLENNNPREITNVNYEIFDIGRLEDMQQPASAQCSANLESMKPDELKTFFCYMKAPQIQEPYITSDITARATYVTGLPVVQVIEMMSEQEYIRRQE